MKTFLTVSCVATLALAVYTAPVIAQENDDTSGVSYESPEATSVVYEAPVIYNAPVVYQAAVAYYAPVYYITAATTPAYCEPPPSRPAASTVLVIGAHGGTYSYANDGCSSSSVIRFGQEGGWFGR